MSSCVEVKADYNTYLEFLRESFRHLSKYPRASGINPRSLQRILQDLNHEDPFVIFQASLAAATLLDQDRLYH